MNLLYAVLSAAAGYLLGSFSSARLIFRLFGKETQLQDITLKVPDSDVRFSSTSVSATTVNVQLGTRYGCLTSLLDMSKVGLPALLLKFFLPESPSYLVFLTLGTVGHNWPVYHGFKGGRGMSTILPGMILVDWLGLLVTSSISLLVGWIRKESYVWNRLTILLMIPWVWVRHGSWELILYTIAVNLVYHIASQPETREMRRLQQEGKLSDFLQASTLISEDIQTGSSTERDSFIGMLRSIFSRKKTRTEDPDHLS